MNPSEHSMSLDDVQQLVAASASGLTTPMVSQEHTEHMSVDSHSNAFPLDMSSIQDEILFNETERIIHALGAYNPHHVLGRELKDITTALKEHTARYEAASLMSSVRDKPLSRVEYSRLTNLLSFVFTTNKTGDKVTALKEAATTEVSSLLILGLCLTQTNLEQMRKELFAACFEEARNLAPILSAGLASDPEVQRAILASRAPRDVKHSVWTMQQQFNAATMKPPLTYALQGKLVVNHHYGVVTSSAAPSLRRLLASSVSGHVSTFVCEDPSMDGLVRIALVWDRILMEQVFGWTQAAINVDKCLPLKAAIRNQIAPSFGEEIWRAVRESKAYSHEEETDLTTRAVKANAFPQYCVVVDLLVERQWCNRFVTQAYTAEA